MASRSVRPPHPLGGVTRVAPYSSRRRPAVSPTRQRGKKFLLIRRNTTPPALPQELDPFILLSALCALLNWSGRADLNGRPPAPKAGALTRLRYAPLLQNLITNCKAPNNLKWGHTHFHLNGRSGRLTSSAAWQESLLIRRDATPLSQGRRANQAALRPASISK